MQFTKRNINKSLRNGEINASTYSISSKSSVSSGGGSSSSFSGDYLPATKNGDGTYTVNLSQVNFNGNIIAQGEVAAYQSGLTVGSSGTAITVYDGLDSESALIALSANQGRVLKELIDSISGSGVTSGNTNVNIVIDADSLADNQILVYDATNKQWVNKTNEGISEISKLKDVSLTSLSDKQILQYDATSSKWINKDFNTEVSALTEHINDTVKHITEAERTSWNNKLDKSVWDSAFYFDSSGNIRVKLNLIGDNEISAYGSSTSTSSGAITIVDNLNSTLTDAALSANQGRVLKDLIDTANLGDLDLSGYSKTSHTHSDYSLTSHTHTYAPVTHNHPISAITNLQSILDGKSNTAHTHNYTSTVKVGSTSYNVSANTISLPSYPTLSSLSGVSTSTFNSHTASTTAHVTSSERTNWNAAYNNNHTHTNKSVLDGITSTKVSNWDKVYEDWNDVFTIDSSGNLKVKVNLIGEKEVSAYGSGSTTSSSSGAITIVDNLNSTLTDAALSANQGRVLKDLIDTANLGDLDLSGYSKTSHTHSNYSLTSHTHPISAVTNLQSTLDGKSGTGHTHSAYSLTSHTHSNYSLTSHTHAQYASSSHTHSISNITNLQTTLDGKSGTGHTHSAYSLTSHTHSNYSVTSHTHNYLPLTGGTVNGIIQLNDGGDYISYPSASAVLGFGTNSTFTGADSTSGTVVGSISYPSIIRSSGNDLYHYRNDKSTKYTILDSSNSAHTHSYAGSSSAGGAATSANKVNSSLSWSGYNSGSFNGSAAASFVIPSNTNQLTNGAGYITSGATVAAANKVTSTLSFSAGTFSANSFNGSAAKTVYVPTHTSHITNNSGYITTGATTAAANKLATARTLWGQSFNGTANVSGNITSSYFMLNDVSTNPYLKLVQRFNLVYSRI